MPSPDMNEQLLSQPPVGFHQSTNCQIAAELRHLDRSRPAAVWLQDAVHQDARADDQAERQRDRVARRNAGQSPRQHAQQRQDHDPDAGHNGDRAMLAQRDQIGVVDRQEPSGGRIVKQPRDGEIDAGTDERNRGRGHGDRQQNIDNDPQFQAPSQERRTIGPVRGVGKNSRRRPMAALLPPRCAVRYIHARPDSHRSLGCPSEAGGAANRASVLEDQPRKRSLRLPDLNHRFDRPVCAGPPARRLDACDQVRRSPKVCGAFGPGDRNALQSSRRGPLSGDFMATATSCRAVARRFRQAARGVVRRSGGLQEGSVIKGTVVGIEKDLAVIDVGLKTEGRVALREFAGPGRQTELKIGDTVEVYLERVENALGEAVLSRDKARREESWGKLETAFKNNEKVQGVIFNQVKGGFTVDLDGAVAFLPRSQVDIRPIRDVTPLMNVNAAVPDPQDGSPPRQHRRVPPHRAGRDPRRAAPGAGAEPRRGSGHRRRGQEHHRLRRVRGPRRHRRPAARHRHRLAARQSPDRGAQHRPAGEGQDHQDQPRDPPHLARHEAAARRSVAGHRGQVPGRHASSRAASPTSPTTARSWNWSRASKA